MAMMRATVWDFEDCDIVLGGRLEDDVGWSFLLYSFGVGDTLIGLSGFERVTVSLSG